MLLHALAALAARPPAPLALDAPREVFSAMRARAVLEALAAGVGPHPTGSADAVVVRERILRELERLGYEPEVQEVFEEGPYGAAGTVRNVVARRPGRTDAGALLLMAHYDSVGAGPGIADDLAGVAALLEIARVLAEESRGERTVIFLFDDGEEQGLVGAEAFRHHHPWCENVGVVLNLEARGASGPSHLFETGADNAWLVELYARHAPRPSANSLSVDVYRRMPNDTAYTVFRSRGVPGLNFAFVEDLHCYHTPLDDLEHLSDASLQHQGDQVLAAVRGLEASRDGPRRGDAVYATLFGSIVVRHRAGLAPPLGLLAVLAILWGVHRAARRGRVRWGRVALGAFFAPAAVSLAVAMGEIYSSLVRWTTGTASPWHATPAPTFIGLLGLALASTACLAPIGRRLVGPVGLSYGVWVVWGMAALVVGIFVPGASFLVTWPALAIAALVNVVRLRDGLDGRLARIQLAALVVVVPLWAPIQSGLASVFPDATIAVTVPYAWLATLVLPIVAGATRAMQLALIGLGLLGAGVGGALTVVLPHETAAVPARLDLRYVQLDEGARWSVRTHGTPLPRELLRAAAFAPTGPNRWSAEAPELGLPPPTFVIEQDRVDEDGRRHLRGRVHSPLGAHRTRMRVTWMGGVEVFRVEGLDFGWSARLLGVPPAGYDVEIVLGAVTAESLERRRRRLEASGEELAEGAELEPPPARIELEDRRFGFPAEGAFLLHARPEAFVPADDGDLTIVRGEVILE